MWDDFGFSQNPYDHLPISADASGERLLVGRSEELQRLIGRIKARNAIPTLEGDIGIGKTSIVSVAAYQLEKEFFKNGGDCYLALEKPLQLDSSDTAQSFSQKVYQEILIKLHHVRKDLVSKNINIGDTKRLHDWLTSEQYVGVQAGVGIVSGGVNAGPNTSNGFTSLGFQNKVNLLLKQMFPSAKKGGIICVIDNLELLEKSSRAKALLEAMRDKLLTAHGIIWVVCGAKGIVRGVASSPRLLAYLSKPIEIETIPEGKLEGVIERRVSEYALKNSKIITPVNEKGFLHIFRICNENLRTTLRFCSDFSEWLHDEGNLDLSESERFEVLEIWLSEEADDVIRNTRLTPKPWEVFETIVDRNGSIAPSDHLEFGYETPMAMRPQIKTLEDAGLVDSTIDETDQRRRTITITPKGWLVNYSRRGYPEL